jgi:hypothetical protein
MRFGGRIIVEQPGYLEVCGRLIRGTIHDVSARGAYFATPEQPAPGTPALLCGPGGWVAVRVVWTQAMNNAGVGLAFES